MKKNLKIVFVIIGTLIGAGFASGREIYNFFNKYENYGLLGIFLSSILFGIIIYKLIKKIKENNINSYNELLNKINNKNKKVNLIIINIVNLFLLISYYIMIACFSTFIKELYDVPIYISSIVFCTLCNLIFINKSNGIIKINEILIPFLIIFILYIGIKNISFIKTINYFELNNKINIGWFFSAILYVSYNSIILIPVISNLNLKNINNKQIKLISIFTIIFITILSLTIYFLLIRGKNYISNLELPLVKISVEFGIIFKYLYILIIIISIFTSSISAGFSFLKNVSKNKEQYIFYIIFITITGILVSNVGFSKLIEILYPLFGFLGLIQILLIVK